MRESEKKHLVVWGRDRWEVYSKEKGRIIAKVNPNKGYIEGLNAAYDFIKEKENGEA
jgi:hypothetical protein